VTGSKPVNYAQPKKQKNIFLTISNQIALNTNSYYLADPEKIEKPTNPTKPTLFRMFLYDSSFVGY